MRLVRIQDGDDVLIIDPSEIVSLAGCDILFRNGQIAHTTEGLAKKLGDLMCQTEINYTSPMVESPELPQVYRCEARLQYVLDLSETYQGDGSLFQNFDPATPVHGVGVMWPRNTASGINYAQAGFLCIQWTLPNGDIHQSSSTRFPKYMTYSRIPLQD